MAKEHWRCTYTTVRNEDLGQRAAVTCSLPPHRLDRVDWGAWGTGRPRKHGRKPWWMEGGGHGGGMGSKGEGQTGRLDINLAMPAPDKIRINIRSIITIGVPLIFILENSEVTKGIHR